MTGAHAACDPAQRSSRAVLAAVAVTLAVSACSPSPATSTPTPTVASGPAGATAPTSPGASSLPADRAALQDAVDRLVAAGASGDRTAWDARTSSADPGFASRSTVLFDNLGSLPLERLRVRLTGTRATLPDERRSLLGAGAQVLQARLSWRLPH